MVLRSLTRYGHINVNPHADHVGQHHTSCYLAQNCSRQSRHRVRSPSQHEQEDGDVPLLLLRSQETRRCASEAASERGPISTSHALRRPPSTNTPVELTNPSTSNSRLSPAAVNATCKKDEWVEQSIKDRPLWGSHVRRIVRRDPPRTMTSSAAGRDAGWIHPRRGLAADR